MGHSISFAETEVVNTGILLLTSDRLWELQTHLPIDEVSPEVIANATKVSVDTILNQSTTRGVALDWGSFHAHIFDVPERGVAQFIVRLDTL